MVSITFVEADGTRHDVRASEDESVMRAAIENDIPGIAADCGGVMSCATCHVHVAPGWLERVGPPSDEERELLEIASDVDATSRLSCQIIVTSDLTGLELRVPEPA